MAPLARAFALAMLSAGVLFTPLHAKGRNPPPVVPSFATVTASRVFTRVLPSAEGGFFVVWNSTGVLGDTNIMGQHFDANGRKLWPAQGFILQTGLSEAGLWDACADRQGGLILATVLSNGLSVRRYQTNGAALWDQVLSTATLQASVGTLMVTDDHFGGAYVVWTQENGLQSTVWAQHERSNGQWFWPLPGLPVALSATRQTDPNISPDGFGGLLITWKNSREQMTQVWAQRMTPDGRRLWTDGGVGVQSAAGDLNQRVIQANTSDGGLLVSWTQGVEGKNRLFFQHIGGEGLRHWAGGGTTTPPPFNEQWNPVLLANGNGATWVAWEEIADGHDSKVQLTQRGAPDGAQWTPGQIALAPDARGNQARLALASDRKGGVFAAWVDNRADLGIYLQHVTAQGELTLEDGLPIALGIQGSARPQLVSLSRGRVAAVWVEPSGEHRWVLKERVVDAAKPYAKDLPPPEPDTPGTEPESGPDVKSIR